MAFFFRAVNDNVVFLFFSSVKRTTRSTSGQPSEKQQQLYVSYHLQRRRILITSAASPPLQGSHLPRARTHSLGRATNSIRHGGLSPRSPSPSCRIPTGCETVAKASSGGLCPRRTGAMCIRDIITHIRLGQAPSQMDPAIRETRLPRGEYLCVTDQRDSIHGHPRNDELQEVQIGKLECGEAAHTQ